MDQAVPAEASPCSPSIDQPSSQADSSPEMHSTHHPAWCSGQSTSCAPSSQEPHSSQHSATCSGLCAPSACCSNAGASGCVQSSTQSSGTYSSACSSGDSKARQRASPDSSQTSATDYGQQQSSVFPAAASASPALQMTTEGLGWQQPKGRACQTYKPATKVSDGIAIESYSQQQQYQQCHQAVRSNSIGMNSGAQPGDPCDPRDAQQDASLSQSAVAASNCSAAQQHDTHGQFKTASRTAAQDEKRRHMLCHPNRSILGMQSPRIGVARMNPVSEIKAAEQSNTRPAAIPRLVAKAKKMQVDVNFLAVMPAYLLNAILVMRAEGTQAVRILLMNHMLNIANAISAPSKGSPGLVCNILHVDCKHTTYCALDMAFATATVTHACPAVCQGSCTQHAVTTVCPCRKLLTAMEATWPQQERHLRVRCTKSNP